eukprot:403355258
MKKHINGEENEQTIQLRNQIKYNKQGSNKSLKLFQKQVVERVKQLEDFNIQKILLGQGKFSKVYKIDFEDSDQSFAVKQLKREVGSTGYLDNILNEIIILHQLQHENVINYIGKYRNKDYYNIILEHCNGGDLNSYIKKYGRLSELETKNIIRQLTEALSYLHEGNNVIHRDVKTQNILIQWTSLSDKISCQSYEFCTHQHHKSEMKIKLADFGFAKNMTDSKEMTSSFGTPIYMAPEVMNRQPYDSKADIWSLGITMYNILTGGMYPFHADSKNEIFNYIHHVGEYTIDSNLELSYDCVDFICHCLQVDATRRLTASQLLNHPFLKQDICQSTISAQNSQSISNNGKTFDNISGICNKSKNYLNSQKYNASQQINQHISKNTVDQQQKNYLHNGTSTSTKKLQRYNGLVTLSCQKTPKENNMCSCDIESIISSSQKKNCQLIPIIRTVKTPKPAELKQPQILIKNKNQSDLELHVQKPAQIKGIESQRNNSITSPSPKFGLIFSGGIVKSAEDRSSQSSSENLSDEEISDFLQYEGIQKQNPKCYNISSRQVEQSPNMSNIQQSPILLLQEEEDFPSLFNDSPLKENSLTQRNFTPNFFEQTRIVVTDDICKAETIAEITSDLESLLVSHKLNKQPLTYQETLLNKLNGEINCCKNIFQAGGNRQNLSSQNIKNSKMNSPLIIKNKDNEDNIQLIRSSELISKNKKPMLFTYSKFSVQQKFVRFESDIQDDEETAMDESQMDTDSQLIVPEMNPNSNNKTQSANYTFFQ